MRIGIVLKQQLLAEFVGTFCLVFCGTGAIVIDDLFGSVTHVGIAFTFGLIVMAMIYALGEISGAHFNPAVTLAFALGGLFPKPKVIPYILVQLIGAILASLMVCTLFPEHVSLGGTQPSDGAWQSFILELILTFILMFVILTTSTGSKEMGTMAGLAIGSVVLLEAMFAGPVCGASMNPARSIGPALVSGVFVNLWLYIVAPIAGAGLSVAFWSFLKIKS